MTINSFQRYDTNLTVTKQPIPQQRPHCQRWRGCCKIKGF